jgi:2-oxoglutarate ferredoxin oxidoreductase subunit alpha
MCLIPEINNGQLVKIIRDVYFVDAKPYNKIMGYCNYKRRVN